MRMRFWRNMGIRGVTVPIGAWNLELYCYTTRCPDILLFLQTTRGGRYALQVGPLGVSCSIRRDWS